MKILFLIGNPPTTALYEWEEIKQYQKNGYYTPTIETYSLIKVLEHNVEFEKIITTARENIGLPKNGVTWKEYERKYSIHRLRILTGNERKNATGLLFKVVKEITNIRGNINLDYFVSEQLPYLIYGNFVYFKYPQIIWYCSPAYEDVLEDGYYNHLSIQINNRVAKNELVNYIENNWQKISESMNGLPPKPDFYISTRDQRIIVLRDKDKLTFKKIADTIISEFNIDDIEGKINEDTVKTAYARAKTKITSLAK